LKPEDPKFELELDPKFEDPEEDPKLEEDPEDDPKLEDDPDENDDPAEEASEELLNDDCGFSLIWTKFGLTSRCSVYPMAPAWYVTMMRDPSGST